MTTEASVELPIALHPGQEDIDRSDARFKVIACGRRFGKTLWGVGKCIQTSLGEGGRTWWVAPSYQIAREGWGYLRDWAYAYPGAEIRDGDMEVRWPGGGLTQIRTAHDPQSLRGAGLDGVVLDEAAFIHPEAWSEALRPALADRKGWAVFISTPHGHNWFWELYDAASGLEDWQAWRKPSSDNPLIDPDEIRQAKRQLSPAAFAQEWEASFESVGNMVWDNFSRDRHLHDLSALIADNRVKLTGRGAFGGDFGVVALSSIVVLERDTARRLWVREVWAKPGGDEGEYDSARKRLEEKYGKWPGRGDPTQFMVINRYNWKGAAQSAGSREQRQGLVKGLLQRGIDEGPLPALCFDVKGPGVMELVREIEFYHYEKDSRGNLVPCRESHKQDDRITGLEYGCEELEGLVTVSWAKPLQAQKPTWRPVRTVR